MQGPLWNTQQRGRNVRGEGGHHWTRFRVLRTCALGSLSGCCCLFVFHKPVCPVRKGTEMLGFPPSPQYWDRYKTGLKIFPFALPEGNCINYGDSGRKLFLNTLTHWAIILLLRDAAFFVSKRNEVSWFGFPKKETLSQRLVCRKFTRAPLGATFIEGGRETGGGRVRLCNVMLLWQSPQPNPQELQSWHGLEELSQTEAEC